MSKKYNFSSLDVPGKVRNDGHQSLKSGKPMVELTHSTSKQRMFISLMDLYEQNYIRLRQLVPELDEIGSTAISIRRNEVDLHLKILERDKYTTTLLLTHRFRQLNKNSDAPNLVIRLYSDARNVEAMSATLTNKTVSPKPAGLKERYRLNRFLYKWLGYLLQQQHRLRPQHRRTLPKYLC